MTDLVPTQSGLLVPPSAMPGQVTGAVGPVPNAKNQFYWHNRTGRELIDRYITGRGFGNDELSQVSEIEQFRRPVITLNDWPDCPRDVMKIFWPEGKPEPAGLLVHACQPQKRCFVYVHPDQWDMLCHLFEESGYDVINSGARFTPFRR